VPGVSAAVAGARYRIASALLPAFTIVLVAATVQPPPPVRTARRCDGWCGPWGMGRVNCAEPSPPCSRWGGVRVSAGSPSPVGRILATAAVPALLLRWWMGNHPFEGIELARFRQAALNHSCNELFAGCQTCDERILTVPTRAAGRQRPAGRRRATIAGKKHGPVRGSNTFRNQAIGLQLLNVPKFANAERSDNSISHRQPSPHNVWSARSDPPIGIAGLAGRRSGGDHEEITMREVSWW
jgi:hypothetical protein